MNKRIVALVLAGSLLGGIVLAFTPAGAFVAAHWLPLAIGVVIVVAIAWISIEAKHERPALTESEMELLGKFRNHPDAALARGEVASEVNDER